MKANIDQSECVGCGSCVETCPEVFRMTDDDVAEVYGEVTAENLEQVKEAVDICPVSVISIEED